MKNNRECLVCGTTYRFCPNCSEFDKLPRWMILFHDKNCHDIFNVANDYEGGIIDKETARAKLSKLNLAERKKYKDSLKKSIDTIMGALPVKEDNTTKKNDDINHDGKRPAKNIFLPKR